MKWKTHAVFGLFFGLLYYYFFEGNIFLLIFCLLGSILPDIDKFGSKASKKTFPLSLLLNILKHRGLTHSIFFVIGISIVGFFFKSQAIFYFLVGVCSHILLDMFSGKVALYWPGRRKVGLIRVPEIIFFVLSFFGVLMLVFFSFL